MSYCANCGEEAAGGARFCPNCGAAQEGVQGPSEYQRSGPGVWSGVRVFFGGCVVLPLLVLAAVVIFVLLVGGIGVLFGS
jgi:uncharacterized membrane protein YvbJ